MSRVRRFVALVLAAGALTSGCASEPPQAEGAGGAVIGGLAGNEKPDRAGPRALLTEAGRSSPGVVAAGGENAPYNYAPSVMVDGDRVRMWWCSQLVSAQPPGDDVLHAEAATVDGPFGASQAILSGAGGAFDSRHTCDPSVIKVGGTYYLYYTGAPDDHGRGNAIGLATSTDGMNWARANGGRPIVTSSNDVARSNAYGAGQPSAVFLDGWFYLMFTDTNGRGAHDNGAGQFVLRSKDPAFAGGVETVGPTGFTAVPGTAAGRSRSVVEAFSADWMWVDALGAFAIGHETGDGTTITFWNRDFTATPYQPVVVAGPWEEGPGLVRRPDGHAPVNRADPCGRVPIDLIRATRNKAEPTGLQHFGLDLHGVGGCADRGTALATLDGFAVPSPQRTLDVVLSGRVFRVDRRSVAEAAGVTIATQRARGLDGVEVAARVGPGADVVRAPGRGIGLLLDNDRLHSIGSAAVAEANSSPIIEVSPSQWDAYSAGPAFVVSR